MWDAVQFSTSTNPSMYMNYDMIRLAICCATQGLSIGNCNKMKAKNKSLPNIHWFWVNLQSLICICDLENTTPDGVYSAHWTFKERTIHQFWKTVMKCINIKNFLSTNWQDVLQSKSGTTKYCICDNGIKNFSCIRKKRKNRQRLLT
jgi:hypothetical protein